MVKHERLSSLDAFRGFTIAGMMLVNNPGSWGTIYPQLAHAAWNGWTFTDFIFPFFLWIMGVAMTISFAGRVERGDSKTAMIGQAARRGATLFLIGIFLSTFPFGLFGSHFSIDTMRIPGVLQRIGICYFLVTLIYLSTTIRGQIAWVVGLLSAYWLMLAFIPVPGYGAGDLTPTGSLARYIDTLFLEGHTWRGAPAPGFDPEGVISTLGAIGTTLFGVLVGHYLRFLGHSKEEKVNWMFFAGSLLLLTGAFFDMWMPINKNLWTPSYAVFMAGFATCIFGLFYFVIDVKGYKSWATPLIIYGMNAIFVFTLSGVAGRLLGLTKFYVQLTSGLYEWVPVQRLVMDNVLKPAFSPLNASLAWAILWDLMLFFFAWLMWRKKWFLKV